MTPKPPADALEDARLVEEFKAGHAEQAFTAIVRKYQQRMYAVVRRLIPDHDDADDVVQEAFIRAYQALPEFRAESQLFTWLYRIAVNVAMNFNRRKKLHETSDIDELMYDPASDDAKPDEVLEKTEFRHLVEQAIQALPEKQRVVFQMRYFDEMPYEEMAKVLNKSVGGLKANYFHAVRKVASQVRRELGEPDVPEEDNKTD